MPFKKKTVEPTHEERIEQANRKVASALSIFTTVADSLHEAADAHFQVAREAVLEAERFEQIAEKAQASAEATYDRAEQLRSFAL